MAKAKGISLHINVSSINKSKFDAAERGMPALNGTKLSAKEFQKIAKAQGFTTTFLDTKQATKNNVISAIKAAAAALKSNDIFLLTFNGHGVSNSIFLSPPGAPQDTTEQDKKNEYLFLYDQKIIDDDFFRCWESFKPGVRIVFIADACFAGSIGGDGEVPVIPIPLPLTPENLQRDTRPTLKAMVITISASTDNSRAWDANLDLKETYTNFTSAFRATWERVGRFNSYISFFRELERQLAAPGVFRPEEKIYDMRQSQSPSYRLLCKAPTSDEALLFEQQPPLTIIPQ